MKENFINNWEITIKHTNNQMQKKPKDFRPKYGNQKNSEKAEWINNMTRELDSKKFQKRKYTAIYSKRHSKRYQSGKYQAMTEYMVSGSRIHLHSRQTSTRNE